MTQRSVSLRWRVTLAFGLLGLVLSGLFAGATTFITEHYEELLVDRMLESFSADLFARHSSTSTRTLALPTSHTLQGYLQHADGSGAVPEAYASLPLGMHEVDLGEDQDFRVGVFNLDGDRLYLAMNLADVEPLETYLEQILAAIVVFGTLIASWLGWLFAGRTIAPVRRLAEAVEALPSYAQPTQLALHVANDELGRLAKAIDSYQQRLMQADERERAFFADASHELRTPLAVIRGTAELLLDDDQLENQPRSRLERLDRGVQTLADLLEALLLLARGTKSPPESVDVVSWLSETLPEINAAGRLEVHRMPDTGPLLLRPREASLVVRGIVRRLDRSLELATIRVEVHSKELILGIPRDSTVTGDSGHAQESGDRRLGVTLIGRLAAQMDWVIDENQSAAGRISIRLS